MPRNGQPGLGHVLGRRLRRLPRRASHRPEGPCWSSSTTHGSPWTATSTRHATMLRNRHMRGKGWAQWPEAGTSLSRSPWCPWLARKALILCAFLFPFPLEIGDKVLYFNLVKYTSTKTHIFKYTFTVSKECALSSRKTLLRSSLTKQLKCLVRG